LVFGYDNSEDSREFNIANIDKIPKMNEQKTHGKRIVILDCNRCIANRKENDACKKMLAYI
jgi:hypothetical protein